MISRGGRVDPPWDDRPPKDEPEGGASSREAPTEGPSASAEDAAEAGPADTGAGSPEAPDAPTAPVPSTLPCPFCQAPISTSAKKCRYCREWVARDCTKCATPLRGEWAARGLCVECEREGARGSTVARRPDWPVSRYDRTTAALFALLLGGVGAHKFYMGKVGSGIFYLLFFWTGIPFLIGFIEGLAYLLMDDEDFARKYG